MQARSIVRSLNTAAFRALTRLPLGRTGVCIYGWPDSEENSLVSAIAMSSGSDEPITLLAESTSDARRYLALVDREAADRVRVLSKKSVVGILVAARAKVVMVTHGLFGSPTPSRGQFVVNLWHGTGPKRTENPASKDVLPAHLLVCNSPLWGREVATSLGSPDTPLAAIGNPREAMLRRAATDASLKQMGLDPSQPIAIWMPTYRASSGIAGHTWRDADSILARQRDQITAMAEISRSHGVQLVVKPHPLDVDSYALPGLTSLTTDQILNSGATLYQLLARSDGLISDYSSVWTDYLCVDRPLLLFCPDIDSYALGRGFAQPPMRDIAQQLIVSNAKGSKPFFAAVSRRADWAVEARDQLKIRLEMPDSSHVTELLPAVIAAAMHARGLVPLKLASL